MEGDEAPDAGSAPEDSGADRIPSIESIETGEASIPLGCELNERQAKIYPLIVRQGGITRSQYQGFWEDSISSRTALYDLQNFVDKGVLRKTGQGPSTRYVPASGPSQEPQKGQ